ncbi:diaminobutyrate acetyltransferase [Parahaliea sp. F7430]|uniref:L-2,4-diaminobutyric acid acetyltransferase n=1 Tax=Sediminihaliea albiluteola TaxID=2758564 RepID=A0A7W2TVB7_9GAMM|nr:diaminobutyrate acetyltransferase [Sediminihaliea albiluteola]MBA6412571.1 diaminobutyrate acetyltransferase [Sediminihaliea albiluteola]
MDSELTLRVPTREDGNAVYKLIERCPPLDVNSMYCNLLQCSHFAETSVAALLNGELVGFVSGYIVPGKEDTLFIWQVAVGEQARGRGLAGKMLAAIVDREGCSSVNNMQTTITEDNEASWALFRGFAERRRAPLSHELMFDEKKHFGGAHASEMLVKIGPFGALASA